MHLSGHPVFDLGCFQGCINWVTFFGDNNAFRLKHPECYFFLTDVDRAGSGGENPFCKSVQRGNNFVDAL